MCRALGPRVEGLDAWDQNKWQLRHRGLQNCCPRVEGLDAWALHRTHSAEEEGYVVPEGLYSVVRNITVVLLTQKLCGHLL